MATFSEALAEIRSSALSQAEKGSRFERLILQLFREDPLYRQEYKRVWLWHDWPDRPSRDLGIDLVAERADGSGYAAIQCKCYDEGASVSKQEVDAFLAASAKRGFTARFFITTGALSGTPLKQLTDPRNHPSVSILYTQDLNERDFNWALLDELAESTRYTGGKFTPRPDQTEAIRSTLGRLYGHWRVPDEWGGARPGNRQPVESLNEGDDRIYDRGQVLMPCGTGKTFTSLKIAEQAAERERERERATFRVLYLLPSISLLQQTMREWAEQKTLDLRFVGVCSDVSAGRNRDEIGDFSELEIPVTTDPEKISETLSRSYDDVDLLVTFSTYHSIKLISDAQSKAGAPPFDLMFCDEAHRTTGAQILSNRDSLGTSVFLMPHDDKHVVAFKRVYMTATPKIWSAKSNNAYRKAEVFSMDDESQFGPVLYQMKFSEAIDKGLLSDYYLVGLTIDPNCRAQLAALDLDPKLTENEQAKLYGAVKGVSTEENDVPHLRRSLSFTNTIKLSRRHQLSIETASERLREMALGNGGEVPFQIRTKHIDGKTKANIRRQSLDWLKEPKDGECRIITNARCLSEGVDVPTLDAALFMSPKHSAIDIVQQVGRVMRKAPGKTHGYIVVPILLAEGDTARDALRKSEDYATIIKVVRALRSHDDNIDQLINQNRFSEKLKLVSVPAPFEGDTELTPREQAEAVQLALFTPDALIEALNVLVFEDCGDRQYWVKWAKDVGKQTVDLQERILDHLNSSTPARERFNRFMNGIRETVSPDMSEEEAVGMLAQHLVTQPVFDAFFENYEFSANNPLSQIMSEVTEEIVAQDLHSDLRRSLAPFYESVQKRIRGINDPTTRHEVLKELYETFLTTAFPEQTDLLGVVYTPVEIVDWLLHSADDVFRQEFGVGLGDTGVEILDPFSGTGTFLTRLIESNLISDEQLDHKYHNELSAIEILPTAYYLSAINIEEAYHGRKMRTETTPKYQPFSGIVLGDTFTLLSGQEEFGLGLFGMQETNTSKLNEINRKNIKLITGNPPWRAGQRDWTEGRPGPKYEIIDQRITDTYAAKSKATLRRHLYDLYIKALRWASDRLDKDGVIAFVTNGGWLEGVAARGLRACLVEEFTSIYVYNLRGRLKVRGGTKEDGGNVFGVTVPVTMIILAKNSATNDRKYTKVSYKQTADFAQANSKLQEIAYNQSLSNTPWEIIEPNSVNDWINQGQETWNKMMELGNQKVKSGRIKVIKPPGVITRVFSLGIATNRDLWAYNSDYHALVSLSKRAVGFFNKQIELSRTSDPEQDLNVMKWHRESKKALRAGEEAEFRIDNIRPVMYRPFFPQWVHYDRKFNPYHGQWDKIFPTEKTINLTINISGPGSGELDVFMTGNPSPSRERERERVSPQLLQFQTSTSSKGQPNPSHSGYITPPILHNLVICITDKTTTFSVLMTKLIPDLEFIHHSRAFPRWIYQQKVERQGGIFDDPKHPTGYTLKDNILDETLITFRDYYSDKGIMKDDIFFYVYGILHHPLYKKKYRNDLLKELPRIPKAPNFWAFTKAGRKLGRLHVDYSELDGYPLEQRTSLLFNPDEDDHYRFVKLKMTKKDDNTVEVEINEHLTLTGIPARTLEYVVNGKSGLGWIVDRYRIREDTKHGSGIVNDANKLFDDPRDFIELIEQVVQVSLESVDIIESLPAEFEEPQTADE